MFVALLVAAVLGAAIGEVVDVPKERGTLKEVVACSKTDEWLAACSFPRP